MDRSELTLAGKIDAGLVKGLCLLLGWLKHFGLSLLGLLGLAWLLLGIFEYDDGLADISWHEWGFMLLLVLLLWRHVRYCQHFSCGFWRGLTRIIKAQGIMAVTALSSLALFFLPFQENENLSESLRQIGQTDPISELMHFGFVLLVVYLSAPTASVLNGAIPSTVPVRVEPTLSSTAKEANL